MTVLPFPLANSPRRERSPRRQPDRSSAAVDADRRRKDYLTPPEIELLLDAAKRSRNPVRDHAVILMLYRHGLRVSELCGMRLDDLDLKQSRVYVRRLKGSNS